MQICAIVLYELMRRRIIKVFGCRDLRCCFSGQIDLMLFDQFDEPMQLRRYKKGIDRIAEQKQIRILQCGFCFRKIFFNPFDLRCNL